MITVSRELDPNDYVPSKSNTPDPKADMHKVKWAIGPMGGPTRNTMKLRGYKLLTNDERVYDFIKTRSKLEKVTTSREVCKFMTGSFNKPGRVHATKMLQELRKRGFIKSMSKANGDGSNVIPAEYRSVKE